MTTSCSAIVKLLSGPILPQLMTLLSTVTPTPAEPINKRPVALEYELTLDQKLGPGSLVCRNRNGEPFDKFFNAFSMDPANAGPGFGTGWFYGLHIGSLQVHEQLHTLRGPYRGELDASGRCAWDAPPGTLSQYAGTTLYAVSLSWAPVNATMNHVSPVTLYHIGIAHCRSLVGSLTRGRWGSTQLGQELVKSVKIAHARRGIKSG